MHTPRPAAAGTRSAAFSLLLLVLCSSYVSCGMLPSPRQLGQGLAAAASQPEYMSPEKDVIPTDTQAAVKTAASDATVETPEGLFGQIWSSLFGAQRTSADDADDNTDVKGADVQLGRRVSKQACMHDFMPV